MNFPPSVYMVVVATDRFDFEEDVKNRLEEGWRPQGGISISFRENEVDGYDESYVIYAQAMTRPPSMFSWLRSRN